MSSPMRDTRLIGVTAATRLGVMLSPEEESISPTDVVV